MADLKVDYQLLDSTERNLSDLISQFQNIKAQTSDYNGAMGSGDIAGAMGSFAGNWDYHRKKLIGPLRRTTKLRKSTAGWLTRGGPTNTRRTCGYSPPHLTWAACRRRSPISTSWPGGSV